MHSQNLLGEIIMGGLLRLGLVGLLAVGAACGLKMGCTSARIIQEKSAP